MEQRGFAMAFSWAMVVLVLGVAIPHVQAVAPWSDAGESSVRSYQRRFTATQHYRPRHLPLYQCHYLDDDECRRQDEYQAGIVAERQRLSSIDDATVMNHETRRQLQHRRRLLEAPRRGTIKVLVLLIRFADHQNRILPSRTYFDALFNGDALNSPIKVNAVGSIKEWLRYNSMGRYKGTRERKALVGGTMECVREICLGPHD
jgi:hypothetical protein